MNGICRIFDGDGNGEKVRCEYSRTCILGGTATGERVHGQAIAARRRILSTLSLAEYTASEGLRHIPRCALVKKKNSNPRALDGS